MSMSAGDSRPYLCKLLELLDAPHELQTWLDAERVKVEAGDDSVYDAMYTAIDCCEHEEQAQQAQAARLAAAVQSVDTTNERTLRNPATCPHHLVDGWHCLDCGKRLPL